MLDLEIPLIGKLLSKIPGFIPIYENTELSGFKLEDVETAKNYLVQKTGKPAKKPAAVNKEAEEEKNVGDIINTLKNLLPPYFIFKQLKVALGDEKRYSINNFIRIATQLGCLQHFRTTIKGQGSRFSIYAFEKSAPPPDKDTVERLATGEKRAALKDRFTREEAGVFAEIFAHANIGDKYEQGDILYKLSKAATGHTKPRFFPFFKKLVKAGILSKYKIKFTPSAAYRTYYKLTSNTIPADKIEKNNPDS